MVNSQRPVLAISAVQGLLVAVTIACLGTSAAVQGGPIEQYRYYIDSSLSNQLPHTLPLPERSYDAWTGSEFIEATVDMNSVQRETAIVENILLGNIPDLHRKLKAIDLWSADASTHIRLFVTMDYLSIGSTDDWVRVPMTLQSAKILSDRLGYILPTRELVDRIYEQADVRLQPSPMPSGSAMDSNAYYWDHHGMIERARRGRFDQPQLIAGHKKDIILSQQLVRNPDRIAIYGWHLKPGRVIQETSLAHQSNYVDYSHGVRLVKNTVLVNGKFRSICDVLDDGDIAPIISREGSYEDAKTLMKAGLFNSHHFAGRTRQQ